jgi:hypothetical protein
MMLDLGEATQSPGFQSILAQCTLWLFPMSTAGLSSQFPWPLGAQKVKGDHVAGLV